MTMPRVEVITSVERRRRWTHEEKERLVAASFEPGVTASEVARSAGIHVSQLFRWRKELCRRVEPAALQLLPVEIVPATVSSPPSMDSPTSSATPVRRRRKCGIIEIELGGGRRVRVDRDVDTEALRRVLDVLGLR
jgi:transposase